MKRLTPEELKQVFTVKYAVSVPPPVLDALETAAKIRLYGFTLAEPEISGVAKECRIRYIAKILDMTREEVIAEGYEDRYDLCEHCAKCSQFLFEIFQSLNLDPTYCVAEDHVYVQVGGKNYDLTAMQFNSYLDNRGQRHTKEFPPVYVFGTDELPFGPVLFQTKSTKELQNWLNEDGWPLDQIYGKENTNED